MELGLAIKAGLDLFLTHRIHDGRYAVEEVVLLLFELYAAIKRLESCPERLFKRLLRSSADFITHKDAKVIQFLPFTFEGQKRADLPVRSRYIKALGKLTPVPKISLGFPVIVAVVDDEKFTSGTRTVSI